MSYTDSLMNDVTQSLDNWDKCQTKVFEIAQDIGRLAALRAYHLASIRCDDLKVALHNCSVAHGDVMSCDRRLIPERSAE